MQPLNVKVRFSERLKAYMHKKGFFDLAAGTVFIPIMGGVEILVKPLMKPEEIARYEASRYVPYHEEEFRLFVSQELTPVRKVVTVDMKRFLGMPDFRVSGLAVVDEDDGSGGGGGGHKEKAKTRRESAASPLPEGI